METERDILQGDESIDEEFNNVAKGEKLSIASEKLDLKSALRVIEDLIIKEKIGPSTRPSEIRDLIASELKKIENM